MPDFASALSFINDYVSKSQSSLTGEILSSTARYGKTAQSQLDGGTTSKVTNGVLDDVGSNPIMQGGVDTITQSVTTVTQQLVVDAGQKIANFSLVKGGAPLLTTADNILNGYYQVMGLVSTASVEILMELARGNARLIVQEIATKESVITQLQAEIKALGNAVMTIMNASPFFNSYFANLTQAYDLIALADRNLKGVVNFLQVEHVYNQITVTQAIATLQQAEALILPEPAADVSVIRSAQLLGANLVKQGSAVAHAAVSTIPAITLKIGKLLLQYVLSTTIIDGLLVLFMKALASFINAYQRNTNIDQTTINHITSATKQLDSLLADMAVLLFPSAQTKSNALYPAKTSTAATGWGIRLATVIQWLKVEPGIASKQLDITGTSVTRYQQAVLDLQSMQTFYNGFATINVGTPQLINGVTSSINTGFPASVYAGTNTSLHVAPGITSETLGATEELTQFPKMVAKLLLNANTIIAANTVNTKVSVFGQTIPINTTNTPGNVRATYVQAGDYLQGVQILDAKIIAALNPFINTPFELLQGAQQVVKQLGTVLSGLGLDRAGDLLKKADITSFYAMNIQTATYVGAAASGVALFMQTLNTSGQPVTDQDSSNMNELKNNLDRQTTSQQVEAQRAGANTQQSYIEQQTAQFGTTQNVADSARAILLKNDPSYATTDATEITKNALGQASGGQSPLPSGGYPAGTLQALPDVTPGTHLPAGTNTGGLNAQTGGGIA